MVVAQLSYGRRTVNVRMSSSRPSVVRVVSSLTMQSCMLAGMDAIYYLIGQGGRSAFLPFRRVS